MSTEKIYYVDIPSIECVNNPDGPYISVAQFATKEEAIAFAQEQFGADENGQIQIVTG